MPLSRRASCSTRFSGSDKPDPSLSLSAWMAFFVNRFQSTVIDLSVNLRGPNAGMAEKLLQCSNLSSTSQHMRRETVS